MGAVLVTPPTSPAVCQFEKVASVATSPAPSEMREPEPAREGRTLRPQSYFAD